MNPLELRSMTAAHLRAHLGVGYGLVSSVEMVSPIAGDPAVRLLIKADDPTGETRTMMITIEEELEEEEARQ